MSESNMVDRGALIRNIVIWMRNNGHEKRAESVIAYNLAMVMAEMAKEEKK